MTGWQHSPRRPRTGQRIQRDNHSSSKIAGSGMLYHAHVIARGTPAIFNKIPQADKINNVGKSKGQVPCSQVGCSKYLPIE